MLSSNKRVLRFFSGTWHAPAALSLCWCLLLVLLHAWTVRGEDKHTLELAHMQARTLYDQMVDTRAWNTAHGGVYVVESEWSPRNPWLALEQQGMEVDGKRLVLVNPAYMTRQIADISTQTPARFRISSTTPVRPENLSDTWEVTALEALAEGRAQSDIFEHVPGSNGGFYRFMAPLAAMEACLGCHTSSHVGDIRGGISVTFEAAPFLEAALSRKQDNAMAFGILGFVGMCGIGGATWQINRRRFQAETANQAKTAFLAHISHDMRTPLSGILGMLDELRHNCPTESQKIQHVRASASSLLLTVQGIMEHALHEESSCAALAVREYPFSLRASLESCLDAVRPACMNKGLALESRIAPDIPHMVVGDAYRVRQIVGNLLGNAVKFTPQGTVCMTAQCLGGSHSGLCRLMLEIHDTGPGVEPQDEKRIFDRFTQSDPCATPDAEPLQGRGLGLAIARQLARGMGGDVGYTRQAIGSLFWFSAELPVAVDRQADSPGSKAKECKELKSNVEQFAFCSAPLFDKAAALSMLDNDITLLRHCCQVLTEDISERKTLAQTAWDNMDLGLVLSHIHAMKNSAGSIGCERLKQCGTTLELVLRRCNSHGQNAGIDATADSVCDESQPASLFQAWLLIMDETHVALSAYQAQPTPHQASQ